MRTRPTHRPTTAGHGMNNSDGHTQRLLEGVEAVYFWARTSSDRVVRKRACICAYAHPASRSPVLTIMSAICTIFDSLMSPPNAYHDDHLSKGRAVGEWTVHRAACLPCPQLLAHMHSVHLTLQHFRKKSVNIYSLLVATSIQPPLKCAWVCGIPHGRRSCQSVIASKG